MDHLDDPNILIVDCRFSLTEPGLGRHQYQEGHIPGAVYLDLNTDLSSAVQTHGGRHPLPSIDAFAALMTRLGVQSEPAEQATIVVAYDDSRFAFAARLWWLLRYLGHRRVAVLNGGIRAWQAQDNPLSTEQPSPSALGRFIPHPKTDWVVDINYVRQHFAVEPESTASSSATLGGLLIDSRTEDRYRGDHEPIDPVAGHIPGAVNFCWQAVTDESGYMLPPDQLKHHWSALDEVEDVVVYCGSGVTACVNLLSQGVAGRPIAKLYAGGWSDWCSYL